MNGRIVITGATGAIGTALATALVHAGAPVTVLTRDPDAARRRVPGAAAYLPWQESATAATLVPVIDGADAVVHLAGAPLFAGRVGRRGVAAANEGKIRSTAAFADAVATSSAPPRVFVTASSQGYYGFSPADAAVSSTEESPAGTDSWGAGNAAWEHAAAPIARTGTRLVLLRTGVFLGYRSGALVSQLDQFRRGWGGWVQPGTQSFNWIHEADEVGLIKWALDDQRVSGPVNLTAPNPVTHREYAETVGRALGVPVRRALPLPVLRLIMGAPAEIIARSHPVLPQKALDLGYRFAFPRLPEAVDDLLRSAETR